MLEKFQCLRCYEAGDPGGFLAAYLSDLEEAGEGERPILEYYWARLQWKSGQAEQAIAVYKRLATDEALTLEYRSSSLLNIGFWSLVTRDPELSRNCLEAWRALGVASQGVDEIWTLALAPSANGSRWSSVHAVLRDPACSGIALDMFSAVSLLAHDFEAFRIVSERWRSADTQRFLLTQLACEYFLEQGQAADAGHAIATLTQLASTTREKLLTKYFRLRLDSDALPANAVYLQARSLMTQLEDLASIHLAELKEHCARLMFESSRPPAILVSRRHGMVGDSAGIGRVREMIDLYATSDLNVIIRGESGTGKELVALALHLASHRRDRSFVPVNCYHLGSPLAEARLFGHRRGAFTGASQDAAGFVHEAHAGTLFLDEVGELPLDAQANLFRFLDSGQFRRVGSTVLEQANVRVIAATNQDLSQDHRFRHELYHRLGTVVIDLPPLASRGNDVLQLARCRIAELNLFHGSHKLLAAEAEQRLLAHDWPGNVRELLNLVDRAWHAATLEIGPEDLSFDRGIPLNMRAGGGWAPDLQRDVLDLDEEVNRYTARVVQEMLERCNRDTRETARRLKISERTVYRWMRRQQQQDSDTAGSSR
ncbi:MAG: sigma-54-dependent Fis family transcriptional regulator [Calditrichaeota bacterium]|nr:sigma-54-dependent Fis family transcriptional regulator [Calditrichota bacterium]MCB9473811.1 sigma-54-dependent Fis family transcriptional regulator [Candidatus Delongbacteria bacterium]